MSIIALEKLIRPAAVTELNGETATLLTFTDHLTRGHRTAWLSAGILEPCERHLFDRHRTSEFAHRAPTVTAARWTLATNVTCRDAEILVVCLTSASPADAVRLSDDLAAHAADTRRRVIFLRPADAMTLPSPAAERLLIAAENRLLSTHYTVAPVFAGQPTKETFPVAQIPKPIPTAPMPCIDSNRAGILYPPALAARLLTTKAGTLPRKIPAFVMTSPSFRRHGT